MLSDNDKSELALFVARQREHELSQWGFAFLIGPSNEDGGRNYMLGSWGRKIAFDDARRNPKYLIEMLHEYVRNYHELPTTLCIFVINNLTRLTNNEVADYVFDTVKIDVKYAPPMVTDFDKWIDDVWMVVHDLRE
jgi:hypothetical protein